MLVSHGRMLFMFMAFGKIRHGLRLNEHDMRVSLTSCSRMASWSQND